MYALQSFKSAANKICTTLAMSCLTQAGAFADEIITDRPDRTESSASVPPGGIQLETGWTHARDESGGIESITNQFAQTLLRIGLVERLELRVGWDGHGRVNPGGAQPVFNGLTDVSIGGKLELLPERSGRPQTAAIVSFTLPVGSSEFSSDRIDPTGILSFSHTLSESVSLGYNLGVQARSELDLDGSTHTPLYSFYTVALGSGITNNLGGFIELFGEFRTDESDAPNNSLDGGLTYLFGGTVQVDIAGGVGLSSVAYDWFVTTGFSVLFLSK